MHTQRAFPLLFGVLVALTAFGLFLFAVETTGAHAASEPGSSQAKMLEITPSLPPHEFVPGADWRAHRGYGYGTINATAGVYVLYFHYDNGKLVFYANDPAEQRTILLVDTTPWPNPRNSVETLAFEDMNGDGYNDLTIKVEPGRTLVWHWNQENGNFKDPVSRK